MSSKVPDFLKTAMDEQEKKGGIDSEVMSKLSDMIRAYDLVALEVKEAEEKLAEAKKRFNSIALDKIPEFLLQYGITKLSLEDGREVTIKEDISATVKDDLAFRNWLRERNEGDIIKIKYMFKGLEGKKIEELSDFLFDHDFDFEIDESIHSQTKKKYFKELLKELPRHELPEWVNIYDIRKAVIK